MTTTLQAVRHAGAAGPTRDPAGVTVSEVAGAREPWPLVGRSEELAMLDEQVGARRNSMVIAGAVGVGKSRLLTTCTEQIEAAGRPVVVVRATRSTATVPFGAFARWIPDHLGDTRDRLGVLRAAAARLAELGQDVVVAVDDAQLLDDGSAALVLHLVQHELATVVVAVRSGEPCPDAVVALWKEGLATRLEVQPLSEPEMVALVEQALDGRLAPAARRRLWQLSQGNPLYLREVVDAASAQGVLVHSASAAGWQWHGALVGRDRLVELVSDRITTSDPAERQVLEILAVGEPLPAGVVIRIASSELLADLERRGLVVGEHQSPRDTDRQVRMVRLVHPLYSEILRAELPPFTARDRYRTLAAAAVDARLHERDPLRVATWMLDGGDAPDEPGLLLQASFVALITADHELSARLAEAAERAGGGWRATLRRTEALAALGRWDEADALLARLASPGSEPEAQAAATRLQADLAFWFRGQDLAAVRVLLDEALERIPPPARATVVNQRAAVALVELKLEEAIRWATTAVADAATLTDRLTGVGCAALAAVYLGRTTAARAMVELAAPYALEVVDSEPAAGGYLAATYAHALVLEGRVDDAAVTFQLLLEQDVVRMGGAAHALPKLLFARTALAQGRVATAQRQCREAVDLLGDDNSYGTGIWIATTLAIAAAQAGDAGSAQKAVAWIDAHTRVHAQPETLFADLARAWVRAVCGELSAARGLVLELADQARGSGAWMIEMLLLLDAARLGASRTVAPRLAELTPQVEGPYADSAARFAQALGAGDGAALDEVATRFARMGARLLAAEAAASAADVHARAGRRRDHAASLATAQRLAAACEGATTPLLAPLDDTPLVARLTDREREVIGLAARGHTSREIADTLTISVRTVDSHLNHAYTKLGITNRRELPPT
jgi:DNA-binding CsgD family transcriptional regulator/type II secretory pathway predicted ATPase ExeA